MVDMFSVTEVLVASPELLAWSWGVCEPTPVGCSFRQVSLPHEDTHLLRWSSARRTKSFNKESNVGLMSRKRQKRSYLLPLCAGPCEHLHRVIYLILLRLPWGREGKSLKGFCKWQPLGARRVEQGSLQQLIGTASNWARVEIAGILVWGEIMPSGKIPIILGPRVWLPLWRYHLLVYLLFV